MEGIQTEAVLTYLIIGHESPCENADFLVEGHLVD